MPKPLFKLLDPVRDEKKTSLATFDFLKFSKQLTERKLCGNFQKSPEKVARLISVKMLKDGIRQKMLIFWKKKSPTKAGVPAMQCPQEIAGVDASLKTCSCHLTTIQEEQTAQPLLKIKHSARSVPSLLLSILVAFFPKCPMCWAAYMSMFGSVSLAQTPYQGWLFPVLLGFLGLHLFLVFRKIPEKGYGPFLLSLAGALVLLISRGLVLPGNALLIVGMLCILTGSLWNSFSFNRLETAQK